MKCLKKGTIVIGKAALIFLFFLIPLFYASSEIFAQDTVQEDMAENPLDEKDWALQFEISDNFTLTSFQGTILSVKYHLDTQKALRLGTSIDLFTGTKKDNNDGPGYADGTKENASTYDITITFQYVRYPQSKRRVLFFYGAGPFLEYKSDSYTYKKENSYSDQEHEETIWGLGISGIIGGEWFVTQDISLLGEYGAKAGYYSSKNSHEEENGYDGVDEIEVQEFILEPLSVKFGVSVYF